MLSNYWHGVISDLPLPVATDSDLWAACSEATRRGRVAWQREGSGRTAGSGKQTHCGNRGGDAADAASARPRPRFTTISRALQWHYSDAPGGGAEMARAGPPCARAAAANIAAAAGYSGRGRRPVAATPSARLFSEHYKLTTHIFCKQISLMSTYALFHYIYLLSHILRKYAMYSFQ